MDEKDKEQQEFMRQYLEKMKRDLIRKIIIIRVCFGSFSLLLVAFFTWSLGRMLREGSYLVAAIIALNVVICFKSFSDMLFDEKSTVRSFLGRFFGRGKREPGT